MVTLVTLRDIHTPELGGGADLRVAQYFQACKSLLQITGIRICQLTGSKKLQKQLIQDQRNKLSVISEISLRKEI